MKNPQNGFVWLPILLIALVIVAYGAYWYWQTNSTGSVSSMVTTSTANMHSQNQSAPGRSPVIENVSDAVGGPYGDHLTYDGTDIGPANTSDMVTGMVMDFDSSDEAQVRSWLTDDGFINLDFNKGYKGAPEEVFFDGTVGQLEQAFDMKIDKYSGRSFSIGNETDNAGPCIDNATAPTVPLQLWTKETDLFWVRDNSSPLPFCHTPPPPV